MPLYTSYFSELLTTYSLDYTYPPCVTSKQAVSMKAVYCIRTVYIITLFILLRVLFDLEIRSTLG